MDRKRDGFIGHALALVFPISVVICFFGFVAGVFWASKYDSKYLVGVLAFMSAVMIFAGVVYSKMKEHDLQEKKYSNDVDLRMLEFNREEANELFVNTEIYGANFIALSDMCYQKYRKKFHYNYVLISEHSVTKTLFKKSQLRDWKLIEEAKHDFKDAQKDYREASNKKDELWAKILRGVVLRDIAGKAELEALSVISDEIAKLWDEMNSLANMPVSNNIQKYEEIQSNISSLNKRAQDKFLSFNKAVIALQKSTLK